MPGSSVHGIPQARMLVWVAIPFFTGYSQSRDWTQVSRVAGRPLSVPPGKPMVHRVWGKGAGAWRSGSTWRGRGCSHWACSRSFPFLTTMRFCLPSLSPANAIPYCWLFLRHPCVDGRKWGFFASSHCPAYLLSHSDVSADILFYLFFCHLVLPLPLKPLSSLRPEGFLTTPHCSQDRPRLPPSHPRSESGPLTLAHTQLPSRSQPTCQTALVLSWYACSWSFFPLADSIHRTTGFQPNTAVDAPKSPSSGNAFVWVLMHLRAGPQLRTVEGPPFTEWELVLRQEGPSSSELCRPPPHPHPLRRTPHTQRGLQSLHSTQSKAPSASISQGSLPTGPPAHTRRPSPSAASRTRPSTRPALAAPLGPHPSLLSVRTLPGSSGWFSDKASASSLRPSLRTSDSLPHPSPRLNKIDV